jgi:hypothetical protein
MKGESISSLAQEMKGQMDNNQAMVETGFYYDSNIQF